MLIYLPTGWRELRQGQQLLYNCSLSTSQSARGSFSGMKIMRVLMCDPPGNCSFIGYKLTFPMVDGL